VGQARWHVNLCLHLGIDRRSAPPYLRAMAARHDAPVAARLNAAAERYEALLTELGKADVSAAALGSPAGREALAELVESLARIEADAAAELEAALEALGAVVPPGPPALSTDNAERLLQWRNLFGARKYCLSAGRRDPEVCALLALERSLEPISESARVVRRAISRLRPAHYTYPVHIEAVIRAIARGPQLEDMIDQGELVLPAPGWLEREQLAKDHAAALKVWMAGRTRRTRRASRGIDRDVLDEVFGALGEREGRKRRLAGLIVQQLTEGRLSGPDGGPLRADEQLEPYVSRIAVLDPAHWAYEYDFQVLLKDIATQRARAAWNSPGGPKDWGVGKPGDRLPLQRAAGALGAWLRGEPSSSDYAVALGRPDAYKEKVWLTRCLLKSLQYHAERCYGRAAMENPRQTNPRPTEGVGREW